MHDSSLYITAKMLSGMTHHSTGMYSPQITLSSNQVPDGNTTTPRPSMLPFNVLLFIDILGVPRIDLPCAIGEEVWTTTFGHPSLRLSSAVGNPRFSMKNPCRLVTKMMSCTHHHRIPRMVSMDMQATKPMAPT